MSWNYRLIRHRSRRNGIDETWYGLHEVYYDKKGKMNLWAPDPEVQGESPKEVVATLAAMLRDATKDVPILREKEMPGSRNKKAVEKRVASG